MNLASQTVLEGLNACLDHRGEVYIAELDQVFKRHPDFKLFAAQNPHHQGGGRKGLPSSFVNRFSVVYADVFTKQDLFHVTAKKFPSISSETQHQLIEFVSRLDDAVVSLRSFGAQGSPWEFNLRDTLRWGELLTSRDVLLGGRRPDDFLDVVIRQRFRTERDRQEVGKLFFEIFKRTPQDHGLYHDINPFSCQVGLASLARNPLSQPTPFPTIDPIPRLREIESILIAVEQDLPCILVGPSGSGKSALLNYVAALAGKALVVFPLNADVDAMDLIGGFEQADPHREVLSCLSRLQQVLGEQILLSIPERVPDAALDLMGALNSLSGETQYESILAAIEVLQANGSMTEDLAHVFSEAADLLRRPMTLDNPRFEWLDGVIVRAVETGAWLVLDNANLCSASVLDRLNSLLERPNGSLSINEHSAPGGKPRVIELHPDFRIFLTVDPRYGELSRAMRNRSIEVYLNGNVIARESRVGQTAPVDAALQRYHTAMGILGEAPEDRLAPLAFDILSLQDTKHLIAFSQATHDASWLPQTTLQHLHQLGSYISSDDAGPLRESIVGLYSSAPDRMLMPLHPLLNYSAVPLLEKNSSGLAHWLATCYEFYLELQSLQSAMESQLSRVNISKPSLMNRLQRSSVADKVASLSRDSTANSVRFLKSAMSAMKSYLAYHANDAGEWQRRRSLLRRLILFWRRTYESLVATTFEEARFQAHLTHGVNLLHQGLAALQETGGHDFISVIVGYLERDFVVGFKLSSGLSMELMWGILRPDPIPDQQTLGQTIELERLACRFDSLRWRTGVHVSTLRTIQETMAKAYAVIRTGKGDAVSLVKDVEAEISSLEAGLEQHTTEYRPFFMSGFEGLRQAMILYSLTEQPDKLLPVMSDMDVLANIATVDMMRLQSLRDTPLRAVDYLFVQNSDIRPWSGTLATSLLLKYDAASSASLNELRSLEVEMPIMGKALAGATAAFATPATEKAEKLVLSMLNNIMRTHDSGLEDYLPELERELILRSDFPRLEVSKLQSWPIHGLLSESQAARLPHHVVDIWNKHFSKAIVALAAASKGQQPRSAYCSIAWVHYALGCIQLFVPDKIYDPHNRAQIEAEEYLQLRHSLEEQITALRKFEVAFTGQHENDRTEILKKESDDLGTHPAVQSIYRPGDVELRGLQGEFNNVLNTVIKNDVSASHIRSLASLSADAAKELALIEQNVGLLIDRLMGRFEAYQDLTMPLVSFLRCLRMGLSLGRTAAPRVPANEAGSGSLIKATTFTPFLGGSIWVVNMAPQPVCTLEFLTFVQLAVAVEGRDKIPASLRRALHESLAVFHEEWAKKLEADRKVEEQKTSLFRHKGSLEDEEEFDQEEFNQLFPDYYAAEDGEHVDKRKRKKFHGGGRELSVLLAEAHERIFLAPQEPQQTLAKLCTQVARRLASEKRNLAVFEPELDALLLPATLLVFDEQARPFGAAAVSTNRNFYTDSNFAEVRKLLSLVSSIKKRFLELQAVDEISHHQTLADVVFACDRALELAIDDPLASIIPAAERLYAHMYEWHEGGWAIAVHKATAMFERLRDTICDWRRLELSSWSRLLDTELEKCNDDAKSWWFIAYGAVILEPCAILQQGKDLKDHIVRLLAVLESYFSNASLGQFASRLNLLRQLKNQLDLLLLDEPALDLVRDAVQNFILYCSRYETKTVEAIRAGRAPLDRKMKDVFLLSKWRDKNIESLRDSARSSHQKLFKLVRKFRAVLEQPVKGIVEQGLPDEDHSKSHNLLETRPVAADMNAIKLCQQIIPGLEEQPQWARMTNLEAVLKGMSKHGSLPKTSVGASGLLDDFVSDLVSSTTELRKETPSTLTDENKELVRHLKTRKTTLYNETLKALRAMGFSRNLGMNLLQRQSSKQAVLVSSGLVSRSSCPSLDAIEYFYHKMLDLAPRFRVASQEHSEDLSREVVSRSIGYLEGVLHVMFRQRQFLSRTATAVDSLGEVVGFAKELSVGQHGGNFLPSGAATNFEQALRWVVQVLRFGVHLAEIHGKLGGAKSGEFYDFLSGWLNVFADLSAELDKQPDLPSGLETYRRRDVRSAVAVQLKSLRTALEEMALVRPEMAFVANQIRLWTTVHAAEATPSTNGTHSRHINDLASSALILSSKVLVALQNFQQNAQTLPATTEDAGWLLKYNEGLEKSIDALRMPKIADEISGLFDMLRALQVDQPSSKNPATALLRAVLPVLDRYAAACNQNVAKYGELHRSTCRLGYMLSNSFVQIASQGFCSPQEKSDEKSGESGQVESGTGLGDGEGAEDISNDIKPDEDLSELAQDPNNKMKGDIENNDDAVDMGEDELEGAMGSVAGEDEEEGDTSGDENGEEDEGEEQAGDVDDLDPTAVDEQMWDGSREDDADKDQQGDNSKGKQDENDKTAAANSSANKEEEKDEAIEENSGEQGEAEEDGEVGQEQEGAPQEELNRQDQNVEENDTLELPDDMNVDADGELSGEEEDDLDDLADLDEMDKEERGLDAADEDEEAEREFERDEDHISDEDDEEAEEIDARGKDDIEMDVDKEEEAQEDHLGEEEAKKDQPQMRDDGTSADQEYTAPSDVQNGGGQAQDDMDNDKDEQTDNKAAQREQGAVGKEASERDITAAGEKGAVARTEQEQGASEENETADASETQPFKKLGDALEQWYKRQQGIQGASKDQERADTSAQDMARAEFQHLQDEMAEADAQALGSATNEEARPMDDTMAIDTEMEDPHNHLQTDVDVSEEAHKDVEMGDKNLVDPQDASNRNRDDGRSGVATRQGALDAEDDTPQTGRTEQEEDENIQEASTQLSVTHITENTRTMRDFSEALDMWTNFQTKTHALSLSLSSQLRLILTPSQSTKLSGSFRTGKRLNIKKIIPYIASSYKRDKIWMRRSIPSKRAYQILLCVDDSSSMGENSLSGLLALESFVMVARALTMLEVGQVGVLGFGSDVFVAHELTAPLFASHDAGGRVLQHFSFKQDSTDMCRLVRTTIDHFRDARLLQHGAAANQDLWQLALILSDGLVQSRDHARLRPLLREAMEQRVMVVFIVMDDAAQNKKGHSVLELKEARFGPDGVPVIHRYLDSFPFPYYLIVHHLEDLPGALAALLRTWFAEVSC